MSEHLPWRVIDLCDFPPALVRQALLALGHNPDTAPRLWMAEASRKSYRLIAPLPPELQD